MKPRKVMVHLELKTEIPIKILRDKNEWALVISGFAIKHNFTGRIEIHQITAQVIKESK